MRSFRSSDCQQYSSPQKNHSNNCQNYQRKNVPTKDIQDRIEDLETKLHILENKYQDMHNTTAANFEDIKNKLDLVDGKLTKENSSKMSILQHMDFSKLKEFGSFIDELKNAIDYYKDLKNPTSNVDEKDKLNENTESIPINIAPHSNYIFDEENRAIVYVKSKIFDVGKHRKGAFGMWWSAGHKKNQSLVIEDITAINEIDVNLHAFVYAMETAFSDKVRRLCIISDAEYVINKMIDSQSEKYEDSQCRVLSMYSHNQENIFIYAYDMATWFDDIKWSYIDEPSKLPGMREASKLIENVQSK